MIGTDRKRAYIENKASKCVDIAISGRLTDDFCEKFRSHEAVRALSCSRGCEAGMKIQILDDASETEIAEGGLQIIFDQHILGFDISVRNWRIPGMKIVQAFACLTQLWRNR